MAALGAQSIASSYEQLLHVDADGGGNSTTHVSVKDGDNGTTFGFTIASDALMMSSTNRLEFGDTGTYIHQSADGVLDLVSDTEIEINATTIDMNGAVDISGNTQLSGTVTVGADGSGTDVIFYSGTAGDNLTWDASAEKLTITGTNGQTALDVADGNLVVADSVDIEGDIDVNGTTNLDAVDIDGAVQIDNTITVGANGTGYDVIFYGDTANGNMTWDQSEDDLVLNDARLFIDQDVNVAAITIDTEATSAQAIFIDQPAIATENIIEVATPATTTHNVVSLHSLDSLTTGRALYIESDSSDNNSRNLVEIINNHASATGTTALKIQQDAAGYGISIDANANQKAIYIDHDGVTSESSLYFDSPTTTTGTVIRVDDCDALTTGRMMELKSNSSDSSSRNLVQIVNDNTSATGAIPLKLNQDSTANGLEILKTATGNAIYINHTGSSSGACIGLDNNLTTGNAINVYGDSFTTGKMLNVSTNSSDTSTRNLVEIKNDHASADGATPLALIQDGNTRCANFEATDASYGDIMLFLNATARSSNSGFFFLRGYTDGDNDVQHQLRGDGVSQNRSGTFESADYAECFESKDGKSIAVGTTVKLDGDKIVACEDGDTPLGVIRPTGLSIVGNAAWSHWQGKYLMDGYGSPVMEEYSVTEWMEDTDEVKHEAVEAQDAVLYKEGDNLPEGKEVGDVKEAAVEAQAVVYMHEDIQYHTDKIPSDVTVPNDATVTSTEKDGSKLMRKKLNPDYDESQSYSPREDRDEWHIVGLLGQIPITKGQPVADNWIKMKDVSDSVEMYFVK